MKQQILNINADLKYIEYLLHVFDQEDGKLTLTYKEFQEFLHTIENEYYKVCFNFRELTGVIPK
jgi:hypothetical protein